MNRLKNLLACVGAIVSLRLSAAEIKSPRWDEILGPSPGTLPAPSAFKVVWRDNLQKAMAEATR